MARSIDTIQAAMIADVQADPILSGLNSTSKRAIWRLWTRIFATACFLLESIIDVFKAYIEAIAAKSAAGSILWVQDKMFRFQYDADVPQVLLLVNTAPTYSPVDTTKQIITRCSVKTDLSNTVLIKIAQQDPPVACDLNMVASAQGYIDVIGIGGVAYFVTSGDADRLYIAADIYYQGQYASTIQASVAAAINTYLANLPFDGAVKISDVEIAIRKVTGVDDVFFTNVFARANSTDFSQATALVLNNTTISRLWNTVTGYIIAEDTTSQTLQDSLTFLTS